jgi:hypothetical protein
MDTHIGILVVVAILWVGMLVTIYLLDSRMNFYKRQYNFALSRQAELGKMLDHKSEFIASQKRELVQQFDLIQEQAKTIRDATETVNLLRVEVDKANQFTEILRKKYPFQAEIARKIFIGKNQI